MHLLPCETCVVKISASEYLDRFWARSDSKKQFDGILVYHLNKLIFSFSFLMLVPSIGRFIILQWHVNEALFPLINYFASHLSQFGIIFLVFAQ
jgi:hypothetical protein